MQNLEPLSKKDSRLPLLVSLRGSLAGDLYNCKMRGDDVNNFLIALIESTDSDLIKFFDNGEIIIGRASDVGKFFPDW